MSSIRYAAQALDILNEHLGAERLSYLGPAEREKSKREKVVAFGDTHSPFVRWDQVAEIIKRERDASRAVLMGDLDDGYAISRFVKYDRVPYLKGLAGVKALVEKASETWANVDVIVGNHDTPRLTRALYNSLDPDVIDAIKFLTKGNLSPIAAIAKEYPNVRMAGKNVVMPNQTTGDLEQRSIRWLHQLGDVVFAHGEKFSKKSGAAAEAVADHLLKYRKIFALEPFRVVLQAHTHQLSWNPWGADGLVCETGCLSTTPGYAFDARCQGVPQRNGYVTFEMVSGKVDIDSVRTRWFDE